MVPPTSVLFDHVDFCVVYKPIGVTMHDHEHGIIAKLKHELGLHLYLVHRLDDGTSGCLLLAKNAQSAAELSNLFATHQIQKYYLALIDKKPNKKQGTLVGDMKNRRNGKHILLKTRDNPAVTQYFTHTLDLKANVAGSIRVAMIKPLTGKTHQIRVALKSIGSPIIGDQHYQGSQSDRLYLHAWGISFQYKENTYRLFTPPKEGNLFTTDTFQTWLEQQASPESLPWPSFTLPNRVKVIATSVDANKP